MGVLFGVDVSDFQGDVDAARMRADGVEFAIIKATEGANWKGQHFAANLQRARAAGQLVAAYHYVRGDVSASAQLANIISVVPLDVPVILDVEQNSGDVSMARAIHTALKTHGYRTPLLYLPRWYWQQIGSPDLSGLPPLWSSHYPDNVVGSLAGKWAQIPDSYWAGYGGLNVAVLQFTSSASVGGRSPIDANAFRGTRDELAALLNQGDTLSAEDTAILKEIRNQITGSPDFNQFPGWESFANPKTKMTVTDFVRAIDKNITVQGAQISALAAAVAAATKSPAITVDAITKVVNDAVAQHIQITGTVDIHATPVPAIPAGGTPA